MHNKKQLQDIIVYNELLNGRDASGYIENINSVEVLRFISENQIPLVFSESTKDWVRKEFGISSDCETSERLWGIEKGLCLETIRNFKEVVYLGKEFDNCQKREIRYGIANNLDIAIYAEEHFSHKQMAEIIMGLKQGLDVSVYAKKCFSLNQMTEIRLGLKQGLDVSIYAKDFFSGNQMKQVRIGLLEGLDVTTYAQKNIGQLRMKLLRNLIKIKNIYSGRVGLS